MLELFNPKSFKTGLLSHTRNKFIQNELKLKAQLSFYMFLIFVYGFLKLWVPLHLIISPPSTQTQVSFLSSYSEFMAQYSRSVRQTGPTKIFIYQGTCILKTSINHGCCETCFIYPISCSFLHNGLWQINTWPVFWKLFYIIKI